VAIIPCPPNTPVTKGVVTFDPAEFKTLYPAFVTVADDALELNFLAAEMFVNNTCCSRVVNAVLRERLLNLLVAHITQLLNGINGLPPAGIVGVVTDATEGSVSVGTTLGNIPFTAVYFAQTQYGLMFWQLTAPFRTFVYIPAPITCADVPGLYGAAALPPGDGCCG
jgi:Protein of unknown function (DUF4054)